MRVNQRVSHAGLGRQVHYALRLVLAEQRLHCLLVFEIDPRLGETVMIEQRREATQLEIDVVIIVKVIETNDFIAPFQQSL